MFIITNSYQYYSIKILTPIFMPILVMSVCPGSSLCSLFVPVVTLQNHTTSYSLNQYSVCLSPERKQHSMLVVLYGAFDVVTANDLWYKIWRWNVDLLLKLVIFLVTWSSKLKIIIDDVFIIKAQSYFNHATAEMLGTILQFQRSRNFSQVTQRKQNKLRSKTVYRQ